jgi:hypothetical protein
MADDLNTLLNYGGGATEKPAAKPAAKGGGGLDTLLSYGGGEAEAKPSLASSTRVAGDFPGMLEPGNVDLTARPHAKNPDGSISTVRSMSFSEGGPEILVPTVSPDGRVLSDDQAIAQYHRSGQYLGKFKTPADADRYGQRLHEQQEAMPPRDSTEGAHTAGDIFGRKLPKGFERLAAAAEVPEKGTPTEPAFPERPGRDPNARDRSTGEAVGHEAANLYGAGPFLGALIDTGVSHLPYARDVAQKLHSDEFPPLTDPDVPFSERRAAYAKALDESREQHPGATFLTSAARAVPETLIGGVLGKGAQAAAPVLETLSPVAKAAVAAGTHGAVTGFGEGVSHGEGAGDIATRTLVGGGLGAGTGAVATKASQLVRETGSRVAKALGKLTKAETDDVAELATRDPAVAKALTVGAKRGAKIATKRAEDLLETQVQGSVGGDAAAQLAEDIKTADLIARKLESKAGEPMDWKERAKLALVAAQEGLLHGNVKRAALEAAAAAGVPSVGKVAGKLGNRTALALLRHEGDSAAARAFLKLIEKGFPPAVAIKLAQEGAQGRVLMDVGHAIQGGAGAVGSALDLFGARDLPEAPAPAPSSPPPVSYEPADE